MGFTKVAPAGIGTEPGTSIRIGDSLLHSTGIDIGTGTGIGVTIRKHGNATFTGIVTAASFSGDIAGNATSATTAGTVTTAAQPNITSVGTLTSLTVSGNLGIGGTLTYEDVSNIDSVGLITARSGIKVTGGDVLTSGNTQLFGSDTSDGSDNKAIMINGGGATSDSRGGYLLVHGNEHSSNPGITRLNAGNVGTAGIEMYTAGNEKLRINSNGAVSIASNNYASGHADTKLRVGTESGSSQATAVIGTADQDVPGLIITNWDGSATTNKNVIRFDNSGRGTYEIGGVGGANAFAITIDTVERLRIASDGKVGISSSIPQRPLDVRGEVFANRFTAYSAPTSTYNNQTTGVKYGARGGYTLTLGGTRSANTNSFTIFDAKDFNNSKYFCLEISFCHAGGGVHGSYRRFAGICNGYTSITTWNDTGNVNTGGGLGFTISKPDVHTLRCVWNGCSSFADSYTLYCMLHVSNGNTYFSAIDSAFY